LRTRSKINTEIFSIEHNISWNCYMFSKHLQRVLKRRQKLGRISRFSVCFLLIYITNISGWLKSGFINLWRKNRQVIHGFKMFWEDSCHFRTKKETYCMWLQDESYPMFLIWMSFPSRFCPFPSHIFVARSRPKLKFQSRSFPYPDPKRDIFIPTQDPDPVQNTGQSSSINDK
jgi:hypothetical protein